MSNKHYQFRPCRRLALSLGGFTAVELLVTIAVLGILLAIAIPSFSDFAQASKGSSLSSSFVADMTRARSEAISQNTCIKICQSANAINGAAATCVASGDDWQRGWIMFREPDCSDLDDPDDEDILASRVGEYSDFEFFTSTGSAKRSFTFDPRGVLRSGGSANLTLSHLPDGISSKHTRTVCVSFAGRVTVRAWGTGCTS